jgi:transcriptional regulator with XRE-family HTH domain
VEKGGTDPATHTSHRGVNKSGRSHGQAASLEGQRSGRSSERVMAPLVAVSISIARSAGISFMRSHFQTCACLTPQRRANSAWLPAISTAFFTRGFMFMRTEYNLGCPDVNAFGCLTVYNSGCSFSAMTYAERLKIARAYAGLTQTELAEKSGIRQQMISKLETGLSDETTATVKLALACGVNPEWLDGEVGDMVPGGKSRFPEMPDALMLANIIMAVDRVIKEQKIKISRKKRLDLVQSLYRRMQSREAQERDVIEALSELDAED